jgi:maltodextrin utilization protein YvdJ
MLAAGLPAIVAVILIFMDQQITAVIVMIKFVSSWRQDGGFLH